VGSEARLLLAWADGTLPGGGGGVGGARFGLLLSLRAEEPQSEFRVLTVSLSQGHSIRTSPREHKVTSGALLTSDRELSMGRNIFSSAVQRLCDLPVHRVGVASRPCKAIQLKSAYTASFRQLKSAIRRSCMYGAYIHVRWLTVFLSEKKRKE
jgi:hypothetical protein